MNKKITSILISLLLFTSFLLVFLHSQTIMETISFSIHLWVNNLIPTLFPFFFLSEFMIHYGIVDLLASFFSSFMGKWFHLKGETAFVLAMSMLSGFPSGAKYTKSLFQKGMITEKEATHLLTFTHFSNPLFILGLVATVLLENKSVGVLILISHYATNFLIGFLFRAKEKQASSKTSLRAGVQAMHQKRICSTQNFGQVLTNSIFQTFQTLVLMLGIITFFLMISALLQEVIPLSSLKQALTSGLLEMTQGVYRVSALSLPLILKATLITFFLSFGGLSVHMQVYSIISDTSISYRPFLFARILHAIIASLIVFLFMPLF